ncbi:MAG TPA: outer membrane beta-barrel protein [Vicinamibacterales bacterium]
MRVLSIGVVFLAVAVPATAQTTPRTEISGGYQFLSFAVEGQDNESMPKGWYADVAGNLTPMIGVVFQVGGNYKTFNESITVGGLTLAASADLKVHLFLGGIRINARQNSAFVPYGQVLVGAANSSVDLTGTIPGVPSFSQEESVTNFTLELGGGVNFGLTDNTGVRFGVDYLRAFADEDDVNAFRFHVGVVIER